MQIPYVNKLCLDQHNHAVSNIFGWNVHVFETSFPVKPMSVCTSHTSSMHAIIQDRFSSFPVAKVSVEQLSQ